MSIDNRRVELPAELALKRVLPLPQAAEIAGVCVRTLRRNHADKIRQLSPRRFGMRLDDALNLSHTRTR